jgi:hypothetical protein
MSETNVEEIQVRKVIFHDTAARVTIPPNIQKILGFSTRAKSAHLVFISKGGIVFIENLERMAPSTLLNDKIVRLLRLIKEKYELSRNLQEAMEKLVAGRITLENFLEESRQISKKLEEVNNIFKSLKLPTLPERDLHFVLISQIDELISFLSLQEEAEEEEEVQFLIEEIKRMKYEVEHLKSLLKHLEEREELKILEKGRYDSIKERYLGKLSLAENRLKRLKDAILKEG